MLIYTYMFAIVCAYESVKTLIAIKHYSLPSFVLNQRLQKGNLHLNTKGSTIAASPVAPAASAVSAGSVAVEALPQSILQTLADEQQ